MSDPLARVRNDQCKDVKDISTFPSLFEQESLAGVVGPTRPPFEPREIEIPAKRGHAPMAGTSIDAGREAKSKAHAQHVAILRALAAGDAIADELTEQLGIPAQSMAPRLGELRDMGLVVRTDRRRKTRAGVAAFVHYITDAGRVALGKTSEGQVHE
jgi:predicted Rossmann fold nucleotide-binding protein DprA/Smf involved in DNA uptake